MIQTPTMEIVIMAATIISKKAIKYRHELKIQINYSDYIILKNRLSKILKRDKHAGPHGNYHVVSLYFDSLYDSALKKKINGNDKREKFRIRYYNDLSIIKLEKKIKYKGLCAKYSSLLSEKNVRCILNGSYDVLLGEDPLKMEFYSKLKGEVLKPKSIVSYIREAYIYPVANIRITLDTKIHKSSDINIFLDNYSSVAIDDNIYLLEIKYNEFIPDIIKDIVYISNRRLDSFSKYAMSRGV